MGYFLATESESDERATIGHVRKTISARAAYLSRMQE